MDSYSFKVTTKDNAVKIVAPDYRITNKIDLKFNAYTCLIEVTEQIKKAEVCL